MSYEVLLLGLLVGCVNYCFRYLPLRLGVGNVRPTKRGATGILLDTIGIASICALLVVYRARSDARFSSVRAYAGGVCHTGRKLL